MDTSDYFFVAHVTFSDGFPGKNGFDIRNADVSNYSAQEFISHVCAPPENMEIKMKNCSRDEFSELAYCAFRHKIILEIRQCRQNPGKAKQLLKNIGCLILLLNIIPVLKFVDRSFKRINKSYAYPTCEANDVLQMAQNIAWNCGLHSGSLNYHESLVCRKGINRIGMIGRDHGDIGPVWLAQLVLTMLSKPALIRVLV